MKVWGWLALATCFLGLFLLVDSQAKQIEALHGRIADQGALHVVLSTEVKELRSGLEQEAAKGHRYATEVDQRFVDGYKAFKALQKELRSHRAQF